MRISSWLIKFKDLRLGALRNKKITNAEWTEICKEYEDYCKEKGIKPDYR